MSDVPHYPLFRWSGGGVTLDFGPWTFLSFTLSLLGRS